MLDSSQTQPQPVPQVLLVEDDPLVGRFTGMQLKLTPADVIGPVADGQQALELALEHRPVLSIIDIGLEGDLTGLDLAAGLADAGLYFVFLSGYSDPDLMNAAVALGSRSYLVKPAGIRELRAHIHAAQADSQSGKGPRQRALPRLMTREDAPAVLAALATVRGLTPRLQQLAMLMALLWSSREIAAELDISLNTARTYGLGS